MPLPFIAAAAVVAKAGVAVAATAATSTAGVAVIGAGATTAAIIRTRKALNEKAERAQRELYDLQKSEKVKQTVIINLQAELDSVKRELKQKTKSEESSQQEIDVLNQKLAAIVAHIQSEKANV